MSEVDGSSLPTMHTERIEIEGGRYLIYYTFDETEERVGETADE